MDGWERTSFVPYHGLKEQDIEEVSLFNSMLTGRNIVAQHHCRYSENTSHLIEKYNLHVVCLVRDLMDVSVSIIDHWERESTYGPQAYLNMNLLHNIDESGLSRLHFTVLHYLPWYISFYLGWLSHEKELENELIWLSYDQFFDEPTLSFSKLLNQLDIKLDIDSVREILGKESESRFNIGRSGRGSIAFDRDRVAYSALLDLLSFYPKVDFSAIFKPLDD